MHYDFTSKKAKTIISACFCYCTYVSKLVAAPALQILLTKKAKRASNLLKRKALTAGPCVAGRPAAAIRVLQFLQAEKRKQVLVTGLTHL